MYQVKFTAAFKKSYKKLIKRGADVSLLDETIEKLRLGEALSADYHDHILKGKYNKFHECHIKPDWLLVYLVEEDILTLTLINTGTHSDLFKL